MARPRPPRALLITIQLDTGCMKYWAKKLNIPYYKLKKIRAEEGDEAVKAYILNSVGQ